MPFRMSSVPLTVSRHLAPSLKYAAMKGLWFAPIALAAIVLRYAAAAL